MTLRSRIAKPAKTEKTNDDGTRLDISGRSCRRFPRRKKFVVLSGNGQTVKKEGFSEAEDGQTEEETNLDNYNKQLKTGFDCKTKSTF